MTDGEYLTVSEAAKEFNVSESLIHKHLKKGDLKRYWASLPRRLLIKRSELEALRLPKP